MHYLLISFFLCICHQMAFGKTPNAKEQNDSAVDISVINLEGEPNAIVNGCVCAITGAYIDSEVDLVVPGAQPIVIQRNFSGSKKSTWGGWHLNHEASIFFYEFNRDSEHIFRINSSEGSGVNFRYQCSFVDTKAPPLTLMENDIEKGLTNCGSGVISGRTNHKNSQISPFKTRESGVLYWRMDVGSGAKRYFIQSKEQKITHGTTYKIGADITPNGNQFIYMPEEDNDTVLINANNTKGEKIASVKRIMSSRDFKKKPQVLYQSCDKRTVTYQFEEKDNRYYLTSVNRPNAPNQKYLYTPSSQDDERHILTRKTLPEGRFLEIDHYREQGNKVAGKMIALSEDSPCLDRIKQLKAPVGSDETAHVTHSFVYDINFNERTLQPEAGYTLVYDAYNKKSHRYEYDENYRLTNVIKYMNEKEYRADYLFWGYGDDTGNLTSRVIEESGKPRFCRYLQYDIQGNILEDQIWGDLTGSNPMPLKVDDEGIPKENGCDVYAKKYKYTKDGFNLPVREIDGRKTTTMAYVPNTDLIAHRFISDDTRIWQREFYSYDENAVLVKKIIDDGSSHDPLNLSNVTERTITYITPRKKMPIGLPQIIEEKYLDLSTQKEILIQKTVNTHSTEGHLLQQDRYDSNSILAYSLFWEYDAFGNVIRETNALGEVIERKYDKNNNLIYEKGPRQDVHKEYFYDYSNRLIREEEVHASGLRLVITHKYNLLNQRTGTTDIFGNETNFYYDDCGRLIKTEYPEVANEQGKLKRPTVTTEYDVFDHPIITTDAEGNVTRQTYNIRGKPTLIQYPDGTQESFEYNLDGTLKKGIAKNGNATLYTYDCFGRCTQQEVYSKANTLLKTTTSIYSAFHLISTTDAEGNVTKYRYDGAGRLLEVLKNDSRTEYEYDSLGRSHITREWYGDSTEACRVTIKSYDLLNRVLEERVEDGAHPGTPLRLISSVYDAEGNLICQTQHTDAGLASTFTEYNARKQPVKITDPLGNVTHIAYNYSAMNAYGQCVLETTSTDPLGNQTITMMNTQNKVGAIVKKNSLGKIIAKKELFYSGIGDCQYAIETVITPNAPDRQVITTWQYDAQHNLRDLVEAQGTPEQKQTHYHYNAFGQKETIIKPDGNKIFHEYDDMGRLSTFKGSDDSFSYSYEYDRNDNLICIKDLIHGTSNLRIFEADRLMQEQLDSGLVVKYRYDHLERPVHVTLPDQSCVKYQYDALYLKKVLRQDSKEGLLYSHSYQVHDLSGRVVEEQLPGKCNKSKYRYDLLGRPKQIETTNWKEELSYDAVGNLIDAQVKDETTCHYSYDDLYQLKTESGFAEHTYSSDSLYNCVKKDGIPRTFNALNQLQKQGEARFSYDANGNMILQVKEGKETQFAYDALDRLITVTQGDSKAHYTYDALNRRVSKQISLFDGKKWQITEKKNFIYQGQNEVGSCNAAGKIVELRILGNGKGAEIGSAVALEIGGRVGIPLYDHNGNIVSVLDSETGAQCESYRYSGFGEETIFDSFGNTLQKSEFGNPWRFSSKRVDEETGFVYFGRRYYDPSTCRWISPDPLGLQAGPNLYAYVMNNPLMHIDLYGLAGFYGTPRYSLGVGFGKALQFIGDHIIPIPVIRDYVASWGSVFSNQSRYEQGHSSNLTVGNRRMNDKMVCSAVNGIWTIYEGFKSTISSMSNAMDGELIRGTYNGSHGFINDIMECIGQILNIRTNSVDKLVDNLREALQQVGPDGQIHHFAHSQGGLVTYRALQKLSPQECNQINVYTFGTAQIINAEEFNLASAINYISWNDPVPFIANPIGCTKAILGKNNCVKFLKSDTLPFADHSLTKDGTYHRQFQRVAKKIQTNHSVVEK